MSFTIDKGVPIPANAGKGRRGKYPFPQMSVGDSFLVPVEDMPNAKAAKKAAKIVSGAAYCWGHIRPTAKRNGTVRAKFAVRVISAGVRCWRIE